MNSPNFQQRSLESINPLNTFKPEWEVNRKSVYADTFVVTHNIKSPDEIEVPSTDHHVIGFQLDRGNNHLVRIGDLEYNGSFSPGEFLLHPANTPALYSWKSTNEAVAFSIKSAFLSRIAEETECLNSEKIELRPIIRDRDSNIKYIACSFLNEMQNEGLGSKLYSETLATQLGIYLLREYCVFPIKLKQYSGGLSRYKLQAAVDYIQANLETKVKLNDLAKVTNTSSYHFSRQFKQSTGLAPYQYVIQQRIELSKRLLKQQDLPIVDISFICGFSSQSAFSRTFRKLVGTTPSNYRNHQL